MGAAHLGAQPLVAGAFDLASMAHDGQRPTIAEFFNMLEQVGNLGHFPDEQQLGTAKCRRSGQHRILPGETRESGVREH